MKTLLVTYAVKEEFVPVTIHGYNVKFLQTGVGKALSAMKLTKAICEQRSDAVLNMGTAGTLQHAVGDIFVCRRFIDRDFEVVRLPGIEFEIDSSPLSVENPIFEQWEDARCKTGVCNTGDSFVTQAETVNGDVVDMEAYAQALVCKEFGVPFIAVKYVTDIIGQNSVKHWEDKLADACRAFGEWFKEK